MAATRIVDQSRDTVAAGFVQGIVAALLYRPREIETLLKQAHIASTALTDANQRVPLAAYTRLYQVVSAHLQDEGFGLFSRPLRPGCIACLLQSTLSAPTLAEAMTRMVRFFNLLQDNLILDFAVDTATLSVRVVSPLPVAEAGFVFAHEWLLRLIHGLAAWLIDDPLPLVAVVLPYAPPAHASEYERVFATKVSFCGTAPSTPMAPSSLLAQLPAAALRRPVRRDEAALNQFLRGMPGNITMLYRGERALAPRIREQLRQSLPELLSLAQLAQRLNLSARTLHRQLEKEGTSLRRLREGLRHELAVEWLVKTQRPIQRIAADLGFADNTSFYRAFHQWEGCGPRAWRARFISA